MSGITFAWEEAEREKAEALLSRTYKRECEKVWREAAALMDGITKPEDIWKVEQHLRGMRKLIEAKYRYDFNSGIPPIFPRLVNEGWVTLKDLSFISEDKFSIVRELVDAGVGK